MSFFREIGRRIGEQAGEQAALDALAALEEPEEPEELAAPPPILVLKPCPIPLPKPKRMSDVEWLKDCMSRLDLRNPEDSLAWAHMRLALERLKYCERETKP